MLNVHALERQIQQHIASAHVPGLALAIVQGGQVTYARGFGVTAADDGGLPVTPQTLFRIGSVTKPLTGTAVMRLVEAGKLDLDRPVTAYVPWLALSEEGAAERVTLRMLMSHTAGLPTDAEEFGPRDPEGLEAFVRTKIPCYPLILPPGKVWSYSNPGLCLVGYIAEVAAGKAYAELMQELVFDPLEMKRTTFDPTVAMTYPLAQSHDLDQEDGTLHVRHRFADNVGHYPAGFAMSTVLDLAHFAIMQMNQGRFRDRQVLAPGSVAEMQTSQADLYTAAGSGYGLTFSIRTYKGIRRVGHGGGISTFGTSFDMAPQQGVAVILVHNRLADESATAQIVDRVLDQLLDLPEEAPKPQAVEADRSLWPLYTGSYLGDWAGLAGIQVVEDRLLLDWNGQRLPLKALRRDLYFAERPEQGLVAVGFVPEAEGPTQYVTLNSSPCRRVDLEAAAALDPALAAAYAGTYASELDELTLYLEESRLIVRSKQRAVQAPLIAVGEDRFVCQYGLIEFQRSEQGAVAGLTLGRTFAFMRVAEEG